jgi:O-acetyl-ADP-ribose deacetylase (regulator of RNase III)
MIVFKDSDLFHDDADAIIVTTNCVGVMGKGIALQSKEKYPYNYDRYKQYCNQGYMKPGTIFPYLESTEKKPNWIINFATKDHWKNPSQIIWIKRGLEQLQNFMLVSEVRSLAMPPLGCGNRGLKWDDVKRIIVDWHNYWNHYYKFILRLYEPN